MICLTLNYFPDKIPINFLDFCRYVSIGCTMHSIETLNARHTEGSTMYCRYNFDQIGGWTTDGVGQGYGSGYPMSVLQEWLAMVE